jgi:hypothetical protein
MADGPPGSDQRDPAGHVRELATGLDHYLDFLDGLFSAAEWGTVEVTAGDVTRVDSASMVATVPTSADRRSKFYVPSRHADSNIRSAASDGMATSNHC